jgi:nicotinate-nucleotide adenylyltransferase
MTREDGGDFVGRRFAPFPPFARGMRIGLFGGTFDPPHDGHRQASLVALKRLGLDRVWWLVTPGNPLKDTHGLPSLASRLEAARRSANHPQIVVTGFEATLGLRYSFETVAVLLARCPGVRFVWIMGADNLENFHRWKRWTEIAARVPIAVIDRPGSSAATISTRGGLWLDGRRVDEAQAARLLCLEPPAFVFLHGLQCDLSSTQIRRGAPLVTTRSPPANPPAGARPADR